MKRRIVEGVFVLGWVGLVDVKVFKWGSDNELWWELVKEIGCDYKDYMMGILFIVILLLEGIKMDEVILRL